MCVSARARVCVCDYLRFLRKDAGSLASSVLTRPNSCMTLSSCLRSSWPFSRNMNSWPLLPAEGAAHTHTHTTFRNPKALRKRGTDGLTTSSWRRAVAVCSPAAPSEEASRLQLAEARQRSFFFFLQSFSLLSLT